MTPDILLTEIIVKQSRQDSRTDVKAKPSAFQRKSSQRQNREKFRDGSSIARRIGPINGLFQCQCTLYRAKIASMVIIYDF